MSDLFEDAVEIIVETACEQVGTRWPLVGALAGTSCIVGGAYLVTPSPYDIWVVVISAVIVAAVMLRSIGWLRPKPRGAAGER